jgi:retinol dehydrogenase-12
MRHAVFPLNCFAWFGKAIIGRSTEMGSRTLVAAAGGGEETHGQYMVDCKVKEPGRWVRSEKGKLTGKRVYDELIGLLEGIEPGISKNI